MGILTSYIENGTKLKSLKFGDGKFTSQPFIQTPIPDDNKIVTKPATPLAAYVDGLVRGSLISVQRSARDVERLTKYMATPSGVQFALKQNLLSRVAVGTETSGFFNEGIYTPLSTLAQAGVGVLGIHLNKQGLLPTSLKKYGVTAYNANLNDPNRYTDNRLVNLHFESIENPTSFSPTILYKYKGGPGSILGIGSTKIRYATEGDGMIPLRVMGSNSLDPKTYLVPKGGDKNFAPSIDDDTFKQSLRDKFIPILGASVKYDLYNKTIGATISSTISKSKNNLDWEVNGIHQKSTYSVYSSGSFQPFTNLSNYLVPGTAGNGLSISSNGSERRKLAENAYYSSINYKLEHAGAGREIIDQLERPYISGSLDISPKIVGYTEYSSAVTINVDAASRDASPSKKYEALHEQTGSYLANLDKNAGYYHIKGQMVYGSTNLQGVARGIGPDFRKVNRKTRGFIDPGTNHRWDYITTPSGDDMESGKGDYFTNDQANKVIDRIYYASDIKRKSTEFGSTNDLIEFSITIIDPTNPNNPNPDKLHFRAYIDNISDTYSPEWSAQTYMGRGEKFHKYNSFDRKISLGFTAAAEGKHHLVAMYNQLNQLAASLAPTYTTQGYMAGNIHKLNVGNYVANQYGIINGLTYEIMDESPWSINSNYQLPMYIKVTGFQFTPIHNFRPEYFPNASNPFINPEYKQQREASGGSKFIPPAKVGSF